MLDGISAVIRTIVPAAMKLDDSLALESRPEIGDEVAVQDARVQQVRRAKELKAAAEPSPFILPSETGSFHDLLGTSINEIAEHALAKVRAHIAAHECTKQEGDIAYESWLETGMAFLRDKSCPFCGQDLSDRVLVDAYRDFFSDSYH